MDKSLYLNLNYEIVSFLEKIRKSDIYTFYPAVRGNKKYGKLLNLGFSCYGLKIYYMNGMWSNLSNSEKNNWIDFINSFQTKNNRFSDNYYIDDNLVKSYDNLFSASQIKYIAKSILNKFPNFNYVTKQTDLRTAINAETKQAISTLYEINSSNKEKIENKYAEDGSIIKYLNSLDWSRPWSAGAQFSSLCVYSKTQDFNFDNDLERFIDQYVNKETGSYHKQGLNNSREIINGAMKVISGLDWIGLDIHYPKKLIDFCLDNKPLLEGCDVVDFVYVLYKCSKQDNHRKREVNDLLIELLDEIMKLYIREDKGFSYFKNRSQTHYYGVKITNGSDSADIHGTTLCIWAINMILDSFGYLEKNLNIIKP